MFKRLWKRLQNKLIPLNKNKTLTEYWSERAVRYGKRSVLNIAHSEDQFDSVTTFQKKILFPLLKSELTGLEKRVLDFGCGPGRFTNGLAELINGEAFGVDVTSELLELAPKSQYVQYIWMQPGNIPFPDSSFDIVWSCLVLGGIPEECLQKSIAEIERVLRPGGIFFFVENTAKAKNSEYWFFRDRDSYIRINKFCNPKIIGSYEDIGQEITIFSGRKS